MQGQRKIEKLRKVEATKEKSKKLYYPKLIEKYKNTAKKAYDIMKKNNRKNRN